MENDASNNVRLFWLHYSEFQEFGERVHSHTEAHGENWMKPKPILVVEIRETGQADWLGSADEAYLTCIRDAAGRMTVWKSEASGGPDKCGH
jgi:hypothetical protein